MKIVLKTRITQSLIVITLLLGNFSSQAQTTITYPIVDTDQQKFYDTIIEINATVTGDAYFGQDANYTGKVPSYQNNGDGTVTDLVTGLMWQKSPDMDGDGDIDYDDKMSYNEAVAAAVDFDLAGYTDWRLPSIREMYSLIIFSGVDPSGYNGTSTDDLIPFIDTDYFDFNYGDQNAGERIIDAQMASSTLYAGLTMTGDETMFGVNFADGRIKGYGTGPMPGQTEEKQFYVMYVRGNENYGVNDFLNNGNGTITDSATGLMWTQDDSGEGMLWASALSYAENNLIAGYSDWRLPNAKELQSILDYTRSPSTSNSAAIDPLFNCSQITDEGGNSNYPFYWTGTTHSSWQENAPGGFGAYVCFGEGLGWMEALPPGSGNYTLMDVHGAGSQRSDPKTGDPANYPYGHGPQGDVIRIFNYVRLVRDADINAGVNDLNSIDNDLKIFPNPSFKTVSVSAEGISSGTLEVYNMDGRLILNQAINNETTQIMDVDFMNPGLYFVKVIDHELVLTGIFIKK